MEYLFYYILPVLKSKWVNATKVQYFLTLLFFLSEITQPLKIITRSVELELCGMKLTVLKVGSRSNNKT